jgi:hypothetical protein
VYRVCKRQVTERRVEGIRILTDDEQTWTRYSRNSIINKGKQQTAEERDQTDKNRIRQTQNRHFDKEHVRQTRDEERGIRSDRQKARQIDEGMIRQTRNKIRKVRT